MVAFGAEHDPRSRPTGIYPRRGLCARPRRLADRLDNPDRFDRDVHERVERLPGDD